MRGCHGQNVRKMEKRNRKIKVGVVFLQKRKNILCSLSLMISISWKLNCGMLQLELRICDRDVFVYELLTGSKLQNTVAGNVVPVT